MGIIRRAIKRGEEKMIKLIKDAKVFSPEFIGERDVLILNDKIAAIEEDISIDGVNGVEVEVISARGKILVPGFIDGHVHIIGGGGEGGFKTRTPEILLTDIIAGGITTIIGCLGTDGITRSMEALLAKAKGLQEEGITTYIYTGSYKVPTTTITGDLMKDIITIDKVIGVGEIAISDHRSSQPYNDELKKLAGDARVGGILSGKAGVIHFHIGSGPDMLKKLFDMIETTEIPFTQFLPTHINRNMNLLNEGIRYAKAGGYIDFTTSSDSDYLDDDETKASRALKKSIREGVPVERITFTSDGQGSLPRFNEKKEFVGLDIGRVSSLFKEVKDAILIDEIPMEIALKTITSNPADLLKLKGKGRIGKSYDADLVLLDEETLDIDTVIARGQIMIQNKEIKTFGTFER